MFTYKLSSRTAVSINILKNIFLSQSRESNPIYLPTIWAAMPIRNNLGRGARPCAPDGLLISHKRDCSCCEKSVG